MNNTLYLSFGVKLESGALGLICHGKDLEDVEEVSIKEIEKMGKGENEKDPCDFEIFAISDINNDTVSSLYDEVESWIVRKYGWNKEVISLLFMQLLGKLIRVIQEQDRE